MARRGVVYSPYLDPRITSWAGSEDILDQWVQERVPKKKKEPDPPPVLQERRRKIMLDDEDE
jgi:hypothetical protein